MMISDFCKNRVTTLESTTGNGQNTSKHVNLTEMDNARQSVKMVKHPLRGFDSLTDGSQTAFRRGFGGHVSW